MQFFDAIAIVFILVFTVTGLVWDVRTQRLPNWLTVPMFAAGVLFQLLRGAVGGVLEFGGVGGFFGGLAQGFGMALGGFAVGFGILYLLWLAGGSRGGDVKFMGALGTWLGAWLTFEVLVFSSLFAIALTAVSLAMRIYAPRTGKDRGKKKATIAGTSTKWELGWAVPYGLPVGLATWTILVLHYTGHNLTWEMLTTAV